MSEDAQTHLNLLFSVKMLFFLKNSNKDKYFRNKKSITNNNKKKDLSELFFKKTQNIFLIQKTMFY